MTPENEHIEPEIAIWTNIAESLQGIHAELIRIGEVLQDTAKGSANESVDNAREQYHRNR